MQREGVEMTNVMHSPAPPSREPSSFTPLRIALTRPETLDRLRIAIRCMVRRHGTSLDAALGEEFVSEVLNETVCRALNKESTYKVGSDELPWLNTIARRFLLELRRKRKWCILGLVGDVADLQRPLVADVDEAIALLKPIHQRAINLHYFGNYSSKELASALGVPTAVAARQALHRAHKELRRRWGEDPGDR
jgi:DNA-directed RNA polymerase specialized sigma24 family protein